MNPKIFINQLDDEKIVAAIGAAESRTSGEIRVFISRHEVADALTEAKRHFQEMGMEKTAERNGVLIFVAPKSRAFAIVGDSGVHAKCGDVFWNETAEKMRSFFKEQKFAEGLVEGIRIAGEILARHFPRNSADRNELPDAIEGD